LGQRSYKVEMGMGKNSLSGSAAPARDFANTSKSLRGILATQRKASSVTRKRKFPSRLFIEKGSSIGEHDHVNETEYYRIIEGDGIVTKGDLVVIRDGAGKQTTASAAWNFQTALAVVYKYTSFHRFSYWLRLAMQEGPGLKSIYRCAHHQHGLSAISDLFHHGQTIDEYYPP